MATTTTTPSTITPRRAGLPLRPRNGTRSGSPRLSAFHDFPPEWKEQTIPGIDYPLLAYAIDRPITAKEFVALCEKYGPHRLLELVKGVIEEKPMIQLPNARIETWLYVVLRLYVKKRELGEVFASRVAVKLGNIDVRLPDILFVPTSKADMLKNRKLVLGAPDLVIEIISPNDRAGKLAELEQTYRTMNVPEILFADPIRQTIRTLRLRGAEYEDQVIEGDGRVTLEAIDNIALQATWFYDTGNALPHELDVLAELLANAPQV